MARVWAIVSFFVLDANNFGLQPHLRVVQPLCALDVRPTVSHALAYFHKLTVFAGRIVTESRRIWEDTTFSLFDVQSFHRSHHRAGMQALLDHSVQNYGPLLSDLLPHRVRLGSTLDHRRILLVAESRLLPLIKLFRGVEKGKHWQGNSNNVSI
jgi:hypothetical protein